MTAVIRLLLYRMAELEDKFRWQVTDKCAILFQESRQRIAAEVAACLQAEIKQGKQAEFVEETKQTDKREEIRERTRKKNLRMFFVALAVTLVLLVVAAVRFMQTRLFENYVITSETKTYSNTVGYVAGDGSVLICSNDGARAISSNGRIKWEMSYQLDNPAIAGYDNVAAVADIGGTSVYVVAENGIPYNYNVLYPIVKHAVVDRGITVVLLDGGTEDFVQIYSIEGTLLVDLKTKTKKDGIPIDIALSGDGKHLVTLYMTFVDGVSTAKVTFYNTGEVGKNYIGNIVGQKAYADDLLVYDIGFLNKETLYVLYEDGFSLYRMTEVPELIQDVTVIKLPEEKDPEKQKEAMKKLGRIQDVKPVSDGIYVVVSDGSGNRSLNFYDTKGKKIRTWERIPSYETMEATSEEIVFFGEQTVTIYRKNRSLKFDQKLSRGLETVIPAGKNRYFLVDRGTIQTIKLEN